MLRFEANLDAMGGTYSLVLYGLDRYQLEAASEAAFDEVRRLDDLLSNYKSASEWSEINRFAAERPVVVSPESFHLLSACLEYSRRSEGSFDITVGPLMKVWGFYKGTGRLPHRAEIRSVLASVGSSHIRLDPERRTVSFGRPGMSIDPGGIGKGYAVDRMVQILRDAGIRSGFVSASTSTVYAIGTPPGEAGWKVTISHPKDRARSVGEALLKDESLSTSGNYEKFFVAGKHRYSHIMDPRTGYPAEGMLSVSVIAPRAIDSEAWTKPLYVNGRAWFAQAQARNRDLRSFRAFACEDGWEPKCAWLQ
ncbi:MAG: FAD:protein FMN transferase [Bryobacteraceae bacterium]|nr:FAD:protein FMN transferase [Bryobacteraceae bacterium]